MRWLHSCWTTTTLLMSPTLYLVSLLGWTSNYFHEMAPPVTMSRAVGVATADGVCSLQFASPTTFSMLHPGSLSLPVTHRRPA